MHTCTVPRPASAGSGHAGWDRRGLPRTHLFVRALPPSPFWAGGLTALLLCCATLESRGQTTLADAGDLTSMPVEKLMEIEVYSPAKRTEKLADTPAAVSVITQEEIQRSGARNIPEALRLVPGLDVAEVDSQQWAISARGFNDVFANKLLVLQDGRSVYTPLFSGVFWDVQDTLMEDIDRIEVIRGPGASLWGANAVNGVINIITKSAKATQGLLVTGGGGTLERGFGGVRYGDQLGEDVFFRVYGKYFYRGDTVLPNGNPADDAWQKGQAGFRVDWDTFEKSANLFTLQGDIYDGIGNQTFATYNPNNPPLYSQVVHQDNYRISGGNVLGRWTHAFSDTSDLKLQMYFDRTLQDTTVLGETRNTYDLDLQHHFLIGSRNDFMWGAGYRVSADYLHNTPTVIFTPSHRTTELFSTFGQDEITLVPNRLRLTAGAKIEHNDYTGLEFQPSGRLLWTPTPHQSVWGAISHAVRTPSRAEEDVRINRVLAPGAVFPGSPPAVASLFGNGNFQSEKLNAYELGYRIEPKPYLSFDLAAFYNDYEDLRSQEQGPSPTQPLTPPPPPPGLVIPMNLQNRLAGYTYGTELTATWQVNERLRIQPSYTLLKMQLHTTAGSTDTTTVAFDEGSSPQQQFSLLSSLDLPEHLTLSCLFRYVDRLPALQINSYAALDVRLAWRPKENLEFAIVGQNLLSAHHAEFAPTFIGTQKTEVPIGVYGQITWTFGKKASAP